MKPSDLENSYERLRARLSQYSDIDCVEMSLPLPNEFDGELSYYHLVLWARGMIYEAALVHLKFLAALPPLRDDDFVGPEVDRLRTFLTHNMDPRRRKDRRTMDSVGKWYNDACGCRIPSRDKHYISCSLFLADKIMKSLNGAILACDLLDDPIDGPRLRKDLVSRLQKSRD